MNDATDDTLTIAPRPRARMALPAACESTSTARVRTSNTASSADDVVVEEALLEGVAGVVDEDVHGLVGGRDPIGHLPQLVPDAEVGTEHLDLHPVCGAQLLGKHLEAGDVARDEDEVVPAGGELEGEFAADAGGGARDKCGGHGDDPKHPAYPWVG